MTSKKTDSIWDDIVDSILNFLKRNWWKLGLFFLLLGISVMIAGIGLSSIKYKNKNVEFEKGQSPLFKSVKK